MVQHLLDNGGEVDTSILCINVYRYAKAREGGRKVGVQLLGKELLSSNPLTNRRTINTST
jgi:hypothetical protein